MLPRHLDYSLLTFQFFRPTNLLKETFTFSLLFAAIFVSTSTACDFFKHFHWPVTICSRDQGDAVEFILLRCVCSQARCELLVNAREPGFATSGKQPLGCVHTGGLGLDLD